VRTCRSCTTRRQAAQVFLDRKLFSGDVAVIMTYDTIPDAKWTLAHEKARLHRLFIVHATSVRMWYALLAPIGPRPTPDEGPVEAEIAWDEAYQALYQQYLPLAEEELGDVLRALMPLCGGSLSGVYQYLRGVAVERGSEDLLAAVWGGGPPACLPPQG